MLAACTSGALLASACAAGFLLTVPSPALYFLKGASRSKHAQRHLPDFRYKPLSCRRHNIFLGHSTHTQCVVEAQVSYIF